MKPARELSFDEVRAEIRGQLANQKRAQAVAFLVEMEKKPSWARPTY